MFLQGGEDVELLQTTKSRRELDQYVSARLWDDLIGVNMRVPCTGRMAEDVLVLLIPGWKRGVADQA